METCASRWRQIPRRGGGAHRNSSSTMKMKMKTMGNLPSSWRIEEGFRKPRLPPPLLRRRLVVAVATVRARTGEMEQQHKCSGRDRPRGVNLRCVQCQSPRLPFESLFSRSAGPPSSGAPHCNNARVRNRRRCRAIALDPIWNPSVPETRETTSVTVREPDPRRRRRCRRRRSLVSHRCTRAAAGTGDLPGGLLRLRKTVTWLAFCARRASCLSSPSSTRRRRTR